MIRRPGARLAAALGARLGAGAARARALWRHRPAPARLGAFALAAVLVATGAGGLAFQAALPALLPSALDWRATALLLERDARPGDVVTTSPAWAERIRLVAPRGVRVLALPRFTPAALEGVRRVWLLSLPAAPGFSWQPELDLLSRAAAPDPPLPLGRIHLVRYEIAHPDLPLARLDDRLAGATVSLGDLVCVPGRAAFRCAGDRTRATVENAVVEVNGFPRPCLLLRAEGDAARLRVGFPGVPVGRALRGSAGIVTEGEGAGQTPLIVAVRVDGEEAAAVQLEGGGWPSFAVDTGRWAGERHAVSLEVVVPVDRAVCLQAVTLP